MAEQVQRRFGALIPVEVRYDEFTDDITANRLVKAAVARLGRMRIRSQCSRASLRWVGTMLKNVTLVEFPPNAVPDIAFDRLNQHYREVVTISRLVLRSASFETGRGGNRAPGFLMDMADLYQLLAYATALDLPGGLLVYAQGEAEPAAHRIRHAGKRLEVFALDLSGTVDELLARIDDLAESVLRLRNEARRLHHAA